MQDPAKKMSQISDQATVLRGPCFRVADTYLPYCTVLRRTLIALLETSDEALPAL